jgi:ATP-dependent DNA ligase
MDLRNKPRLRIVTNPSSSSDRVYETILYTDGTTSCNCRGWIFSGAVRGCRHTEDLEAEEAARTASTPPEQVSTTVRAQRSEEAAIQRAEKALGKPKKKKKLLEQVTELAAQQGFTMRDIEVMTAGVLDEKALKRVWDSERWVAEEKVDGARYVLHLGSTNRLFSRRKSSVDGKRIERTNNVPHLRDLKHDLDGTILDGEIVTGENCKSNDVTRIMGSHPDMAVLAQDKNGWVFYKPFDIIQYKGKSVENEPYKKRRKLLWKVIGELNSDYITVVSAAMTDKKAFFDSIIKAGGEGVILKDLDGLYVEGQRSKAWIKVKRENNWNVVCMGFTKGKNAMADTFGAMKFGMYIDGKLTEVGQCSGMTLGMRREIHANREKYLGRVFEVKGQEITDGGRIRHPRFKAWRLDVRAEDCQLEDERESK